MSSLYNLYITERDRSIKGLNMSALSLLDESINCGISTLDEEFECVCVLCPLADLSEERCEHFHLYSTFMWCCTCMYH